MILPCAAGQEFDLTADLIAALRNKFMLTDNQIHSELLKINLWLHKNPARRPQPRTFLRFVESWLKKLQLQPPKPEKRIGGAMTPGEIERMAADMNMPPRPGETYPQLLRRLQASRQ